MTSCSRICVFSGSTRGSSSSTSTARLSLSLNVTIISGRLGIPRLWLLDIFLEVCDGAAVGAQEGRILREDDGPYAFVVPGV